MSDERTERVRELIEYHLGISNPPGEYVRDCARQIAALGDEPLEDVLNAAWWITHFEVTANEDEQYDALITGYVSEDGFRSGEGTGPTIDKAIRAAVQRAKDGER